MKVVWLSIALLASIVSNGSASVHWSAVTNPGQLDQVEIFLPGSDDLYAGTTMGQVVESSDHGATWTSIADGLPQDYAPIQSMVFANPWIIVSRSGFGQHNYCSHLENGVWSTWEALPYQDAPVVSLSAIGDDIFGLLAGGIIEWSGDHGLSWASVTQPGGIGKIFVEQGVLFATTQSFGGHMYRSTDLGQTWTSIGDGLGSSYVCSHVFYQGQLVVSLYNSGGIGTVWTSGDFGTTWHQLTTLPTNRNMNGMAIGADGSLVIGASGTDAQGQSVWRSRNLVQWDDLTGDLPDFARPFNDLVYEDGWFFKTGGSVTAYRVQDPAASDAGPIQISDNSFGAYPNPARDQAQMRFSLSAPASVSLEVLDSSGRALAHSQLGSLPAGQYQLPWNAKDSSGRPLPGGVYFARLSVGGRSQIARLVLIRQ
jgi:hypothetical protein